MLSFVFLLISFLFITLSFGADPTNYEFYTSGGIKTGLKADSVDFTLNGREITLLGGSLHYFRIPQQYWRDRLIKQRAAGLNAVQTYTPWNLHEENPGQFDFESSLLNLRQFLKLAKESDLFVIIRIGPYICAEWEMGGFPAWLLRDPHMKTRSNYKPYLSAVEKWFKKVLNVINEYQFTKGGPIIALQFENEFRGLWKQDDWEYFQFMRQVIENSNFKELLFNCEPAMHASLAAKGHHLPGILETTNFNDTSLVILNALRKSQPNKPIFVSEFWPGWFDQWGDKTHYTHKLKHFEKELTDVLFIANASVNFYMFTGGTNFGFTNGGEPNRGVVTSYDYDSPISESGNYTDKYWKVKELITRLTKERHLPKTHIPEPPKVESAANYGYVKIVDKLYLDDILDKINPIKSEQPKHMELLDIGPNYGQHFGFILYRMYVNIFKTMEIMGGVTDRGIVLIEGKEVAIVNHNKDFFLNTSLSWFSHIHTMPHYRPLDVIVENTGRTNWSPYLDNSRKGLNGNVIIHGRNGGNVSKYTIYPMEFKQKFVEQLKHIKGWPIEKVNTGPSLFRAVLDIKDKPRDTFIRLDNWKKGNVFVNGFNIGRYYEIGPQKTLYIPAPLLKTGINDIYVFELHSGTDSIQFVDKPDLGPKMN